MLISPIGSGLGHELGPNGASGSKTVGSASSDLPHVSAGENPAERDLRYATTGGERSIIF